MGDGCDWIVDDDAAMIENFLEFGDSFATLLCGEICLTAEIDGV
jgi:hypothetical protein